MFHAAKNLLLLVCLFTYSLQCFAIGRESRENNARRIERNATLVHDFIEKEMARKGEPGKSQDEGDPGKYIVIAQGSTFVMSVLLFVDMLNRVSSFMVSSEAGLIEATSGWFGLGIKIGYAASAIGVAGGILLAAKKAKAAMVTDEYLDSKEGLICFLQLPVEQQSYFAQIDPRLARKLEEMADFVRKYRAMQIGNPNNGAVMSSSGSLIKREGNQGRAEIPEEDLAVGSAQ